MIKRASQILGEMIADFIAEQDKVNFLGINSAIRGCFVGIANQLSEVWNDITQTKRDNQIQTAKGDDLSVIAGWDNLSKRGPAYSSVPCIFSGPGSQVILAGTQVRAPGSNAIFSTLEDITIGRNYNQLGHPILSNTLGDTVLCISIDTGSASKVQAGEITELVTPISGVSVINLVPSTGGADTETDEELRARSTAKNELPSQGVTGYYLGIAQQANDNVLKAFPKFNYAADSVDLYLLRRGLGGFTNDELTAIAAYVNGYNKGGQPVHCYNSPQQGISIYIELTSKQGVDPAVLYRNLAISISDYIDREILEYGAVVVASRVLTILLEDANTVEVDLDTYTINGGKDDIYCGASETPRFISLSGKINGSSMPMIVAELTQSYYA
jgi:hypothetical protein